MRPLQIFRFFPGVLAFLFFSGFCAEAFSREARFLVKLNPNYKEATLKKATSGTQPAFSVKRLREYTDTPTSWDGKWAVLIIPEDGSLLSTTELEATGLFEYVEPDHIGYAAGISRLSTIPNDPGFPSQWYLDNDGSFSLAPSTPGADIQMPEAWQITTGDNSVTVAILDSGIDSGSPEFEGRLWNNTAEKEDETDNDGNGLSDNLYGWDFINDDGLPEDDNGHGTAVAGILAATGNNGYGFAGIDWQCKLMICKVVNKDLSGYYSQWISGIYYAVDHGARIINFSLAGDKPSKALEEAINYANQQGVLIVSSMYNLNNSEPYYPAAYGPVIAVGATDPNDKRSIAFNGNPQYGSNYGNHIDVVAPGNYIRGLNKPFTGTGTLWSGTSMATPIVSGIASLLWAQYPSGTVEDIKTLIYTSAEDQVGPDDEDTPGWDPYYGYGRVNAYRALSGDTATINVQLKIFPNPAVTSLYIEYQLEETNFPLLFMVNMTGQVVWKTQKLPRNKKIQVDISHLSAGLYLVVLEYKTNRLTRKLIVVH